MTASDSTKQVLYVSWNSIEEPLVHSQVLNYLRGLAGFGWRFVLVTMESPASVQSQDWLLKHRFRLKEQFGAQLEWQPVRLSRGVARMGLLARALAARRQIAALLRRSPFALIHARSYLPAWLVAGAADRAGVPWLFDARGFWVDEKVYKGSLRQNGFTYRFLKRMERKLYTQARAVVMLAEAGKKSVQRLYPSTQDKPVRVIPTCVDTARFRPQTRGNHTVPAKRLLCVGSVGEGYLGREVFRVFAQMHKWRPDFVGELCTRSHPGLIQQLATETGIDPKRLKIHARSHEEMKDVLSQGGIGLSLIQPHVSKQASCPTKVGEYLACGMPVIYNSGIGDMDEVLGDGDVAVRCDDFSEESIRQALDKAVTLFESAAARRRCRRLAEDYFSLEKGVAAYHQLYQEMLVSPVRAGQRGRPETEAKPASCRCRDNKTEPPS